MTATDKYLPHLDGLRAIALMGVLAFHFELPFARGGFAGVDVFLSLSGFLITRNIVHSLHMAEFSLRNFYTRRFFRLLPSAALVSVASAFLTATLFPPPLARSALASARAALLLHANTFFHSQAGYFDQAAHTKPLLHMWSLSLEEQFYLVWAPLQQLLSWLPHAHVAMPAASAVLMAASFAVALLANASHPSFVFYELPPRVFQFAAGALVSFFFPVDTAGPVHNADTSAAQWLQPVSPAPQSPSVALPSFLCAELTVNLLSGTALVTLLASYSLLPRGATVLQMTPTTLATCVLIATPSSALSRHALSLRPLQHLGQVSYSAYLVHWPLYVVSRFLSFGFLRLPPPPHLLLALTYVLGVMLKRGIEDPLRWGKCPTARAAFVALLPVLVLLTHVASKSQAVGVSGPRWNEGLGVAPPELREYGSVLAHVKSNWTRGKYSFEYETIGNGAHPSNRMLLLGNSYLHHQRAALGRIAARRNVSFVGISRPKCMVGPRRLWEKSEPCKKARARHWAHIDALPGPHHIVVFNSLPFVTEALVRNFTAHLYADIRAAGHRLSIVSSPPMPDREFAGNYFACADAAFTWLGRLRARRRREPFRGAAHCVDVAGSFALRRHSAMRARVMSDLARTAAPGLRVLDWKRGRCRRDRDAGNLTDEFRCDFAVHHDDVVYDIGMKRDGKHQSDAAAFNTADVLEEFLFPAAEPLRVGASPKT